MAMHEVLLELRREHGISQKQLADAIGISQSTIAKIEINRNEANASTIRKLADFFNVSTDYLLERVDDFGSVIQSTTSSALSSRKEKKSVMERPTSELAENFIRENMELLQEKAFIEITKLYKLLNEAQKIYVVAYLMGYMQREGVDTSSIGHF